MKSKLKEFYLANKSLILILSIFITGCLYILVSNNHREKSLKKSKITWSIIESINRQAKFGKSLDIYYFNDKGKMIKIKNLDPPDGCTGIVDIKDTILIKYSLLDNDVIEILDCTWNERSKNKID